MRATKLRKIEMIETIANMETAQSAAQVKKQAARDDVAAGFSFAAAMTALEGRASQSLKTFGAAPRETVATGGQAQTGGADAPKPDAASAPEDSANGALHKPATPQHSANMQASQTKSAPQQTAPAQPPAAPRAAIAVSAVSAVIIPAQPIQAPALAARTEAAALRAADNLKTATAKAPAAPRPVQAPTQDFAKLLARRLDSGATSFELRLDPPELGRIEARLKVGDDGQSTLALKFDNQTALDLFARDEAGLRVALMASGFDLGGERLAFSLRDDDETPAPTALSATAETASYEPLFHAPYSQGAVDLRI